MVTRWSKCIAMPVVTLVVENDCNHYGSNWTEGPCVTTGCDTEGERVRTRQCLYDDGRETNKV